MSERPSSETESLWTELPVMPLRYALRFRLLQLAARWCGLELVAVGMPTGADPTKPMAFLLATSDKAAEELTRQTFVEAHAMRPSVEVVH
jgi:hypothetical protein